MGVEDLAGACRGDDELLDIVRSNGVIECVCGGHGADEDQHDEAHALLAVIGTVGEAHAGAGEDSSERMGQGGGVLSLGACVQRGVLDNAFESSISSAAGMNPTMGEMSSTLKTLWPVPSRRRRSSSCALMSWLARPTPMMEPTMVCELDAGRPKYHVPRFQRMAAMRRANTMANPAPELTWRMSSTGSRVMTLKATAPEEARTPQRLQMPDQTTAMLGPASACR